MKNHALLLGAALIFSLSAETAYAGDHGALGVVLSSQQSDQSGGVTVTGILARSPAAQAGIQPGDRIMAIDGQQVADYHDVMRLVGAKQPGSQVGLGLARGAWRTTKTVSLGRSQQVFEQPQAVSPWSASSNMPVGAVPVWSQHVWQYPRPGQTSYPAERWRTHPHDDILTSLYNSDF